MGLCASLGETPSSEDYSCWVNFSKLLANPEAFSTTSGISIAHPPPYPGPCGTERNSMQFCTNSMKPSDSHKSIQQNLPAIVYHVTLLYQRYTSSLSSTNYIKDVIPFQIWLSHVRTQILNP